MRPLRDLAIRQKLLLIIALTSVVTIVLGVLARGGYEWLSFRDATRRIIAQELSPAADSIKDDAAAALASNDEAAVLKSLSSLCASPEIVAARIFTTNGVLVAECVDKGVTPPPFSGLVGEGSRIEGPYVVFRRNLFFHSQPVGRVVLRADIHERQQLLKRNVSVSLAGLVAATLIALVLSFRLQRIVSEPIQDLARLAQTVTSQKDYSLRARARGGDEIGALIHSFNQMLDQIQKHDEKLRESEQRFREVTETIREVFWMTEAGKTQMMYVSAAYEEIWGRTRESLYQSPDNWFESIHADDRERVRRATLAEQDSGTYDEEYRIVRPDGTVRWIRERAFPVRDNRGTVYRIAGVADDITEKKLLQSQLLEVSDREQVRIGQDLHDGLCQQLVSVALTADLVRRDSAEGVPPRAAYLERIRGQLNDAIAQARGLARELYPVEIEREGLGAALRKLAGDLSQQHRVRCAAECSEAVAVRNLAAATHVYRIAQEAMHNAIKHAEPASIDLGLIADGETIRLTITDDGHGIDETRARSSGMGLNIMRYRAAMIGGELSVRRSASRGTIVTCIFPRKAL